MFRFFFARFSLVDRRRVGGFFTHLSPSFRETRYRTYVDRIGWTLAEPRKQKKGRSTVDKYLLILR